MNVLHRGLMLSLVAIGLGGGLLPLPELAQAQKREPALIQYDSPQKHFVFENTDKEPKGRSRGGASRGCQQSYQNLAALVPKLQLDQQETLGGLTAMSHPVFWFYVPSELTREVSLEFVLQDSQDEVVYQTTLKGLKTAAGTISIGLPEGTEPLNPNQPYYWTLSILCDPADSSNVGVLQGSIRRVLLPKAIQQKIEAAKTPLEQAKQYANYGIWYDALTALGKPLQSRPPQDPIVGLAWQDLLQQVGLTEAAKSPIVPCCQPPSN